MPVLVKTDRAAFEVKKGDFIFDHEVVEVDKARVNTHIFVDTGRDEEGTVMTKRYSFKHEDLLTVGRLEKTAEEKRQEDLETRSLAATRIVKQLERLAFMDVHAWFAEKQAGYSDWAQGASWHVEEALRLSALKAFAATCISDRVKDNRTDIDVARWAIAEATKRVLNGARFPSRSTSQMSNMASQVALEAVAKWLDDSEVAWFKHIDQHVESGKEGIV